MAPHYGDQPLKTTGGVRSPRSIKNKNNNERITSFRDRIYALSSAAAAMTLYSPQNILFKSIRADDDNNNNILRRGEIARVYV